MAVLSSSQLDRARQEIASESDVVTWRKEHVNNAMQAIEDWWEANQASLSAAIDAASSPVSFTVQQKRRIAKQWLHSRFNVGG